MISNEREDLIKFIQSHPSFLGTGSENQSGENLTALSDAELRQRVQIIMSTQAFKKLLK